MGIQLKLKKNIFLIKFFIYKKDVLKYYKHLLKSQKLSKEELLDYKFKEFLKVIKHAYNNSSFYKKKYFEANFHPESIKTFEDIKKVPILTKQEIKDNLENILTTKKKYSLVLGATGGSTGKPMAYYFDKSIPLEAFSWRYLNWWGINPWDDGAFIWRMIRINRIRKLLNGIAWWPVKKIRLDANFLDKKKLDLFAKKINKFKPKLIQGYIGAVYEFALFLDSNNINIHSPNAIWVTSAPVADHQRNLIEKVFKAPLYNEYGSSEIPWIAAQCEKRKFLHINEEARYVEIINKNERDEGDIIITDLLNKSFPLIRYQIGDKSSFVSEQCSCGKNLQLMKEVKGRISDFITIPNLGKIEGSFLTTIFDSYPNSIMAFQLIQHKNTNLTLRVVPNKNYSNWESEVEIVMNNLLGIIKNKLIVKLEYCDEIKSDKGKSRFIIRE